MGRDAEADLPRRRALGVGLATAVVTRRAPLRTADYAAACEREGVVPVPEALALPHWLGVPIVAGDDVLGVLTLADAAHPFTEADERLLSNIASLTALALRSARLYEERRRRTGSSPWPRTTWSGPRSCGRSARWRPESRTTSTTSWP